MAACNTVKRKREIQDENNDRIDNFQLLSHVGERKKRRLNTSHSDTIVQEVDYDYCKL